MFGTVALIAILSGAVFTGVSSWALRSRPSNDDETDEEVESIDAASDAALNEINKTGQLILDEIDEKYQSLLFIYNMLDEKKKEIALMPTTPEPRPARAAAVSSKPKPLKPPIFKNPKFGQIMELHKNGMSVPEIAQALDMGQGEVQLILELGSR